MLRASPKKGKFWVVSRKEPPFRGQYWDVASQLPLKVLHVEGGFSIAFLGGLFWRSHVNIKIWGSECWDFGDKSTVKTSPKFAEPFGSHFSCLENYTVDR